MWYHARVCVALFAKCMCRRVVCVCLCVWACACLSIVSWRLWPSDVGLIQCFPVDACHSPVQELHEKALTSAEDESLAARLRMQERKLSSRGLTSPAASSASNAPVSSASARAAAAGTTSISSGGGSVHSGANSGNTSGDEGTLREFGDSDCVSDDDGDDAEATSLDTTRKLTFGGRGEGVIA